MESIIKIKSRMKMLLILCMLLSLVFVVCSLFVGRYSVPLNKLPSLIERHLNQDPNLLLDKDYLVLTRIRLPRIFACMIVGASLSVSGCVFQSLFNNPMASSNVLGVNQGAALGAVWAILYNLSSHTVIVFSFVTGLLSVAIVYGLSYFFRIEKNVGLILSGMVVGSLFQAGVSLTKLVADPTNQLPSIIYWLTGSLSEISWDDIRIVYLPVIIGLVLVLIIREPLNLLNLGEEKAKTLGVNTNLVKIIAVSAATLLTASCVSISGMIGWVGLIIPHICRLIIGNDHRFLIPCSFLLGISFVTVVDSIARSIYHVEIPIGILTALLGGPVFIVLLRLNKGENFFDRG